MGDPDAQAITDVSGSERLLLEPCSGRLNPFRTC